MSSAKLGVGLIGCGRIADLQCLGYLDHPRAEIVAVCDVDGTQASRRAQRWRVGAVYDDHLELLADERVHAVEILTPHHLHADQAVAALAAGKHVSLQKPPARTLEEFDRIAAAADASNAVFRVFENFMHYPPHLKAKELIDDGAIGMPLSIRMKTAAGRPDAGWEITPSSQAWRMDLASCGGGPVTFDHGYHCYNMARWFMPYDVERVHAFINWTKFSDGLVHDGPSMITWRYAGTPACYGSWEVIASIGMRVRSSYYVSDDRIEIHGSEGIIWVNRCSGKLLDEPSVVLYREGETRAFHDIEADWAESFRRGGHDFVDAIAEGRQPALDAADARAVLEMALAAGRSAEAGVEVALGDGAP